MVPGDREPLVRPSQNSLLALLSCVATEYAERLLQTALKTIVGHWLTQASLRLPPTYIPPLPISSDPTLTDADLGPDSVGRLVGELAVHRESFSRVWSGSPAALECILDALLSIGAENERQPLEFRLFDPPESSHGLSLQ